MDMVERVARALAANEGYDPDEMWEEFDRTAAATDMMCGGVSEDQIFLKFVRWREYEVQAKAAIRAVLEGLEQAGPVTSAYECPDDAAFVRFPLYDIRALKEAIQ